MRSLVVLVMVFLLPLSTLAAQESSEVPSSRSITLTIVYDNYQYKSQLKTAWGFSCLIEGYEERILFDTGGKGEILLSNMNRLNIDPGEIDTVVLSHIHGDHTGGLGAFLKENPDVTVFLPRSFPPSFMDDIRESGGKIVEVAEETQICDGVYSIGVMGHTIQEQGLALNSPQGTVVITGCAHPGIAEMVERAKEITGDIIYLVLGGFHLSSASSSGVKGIVKEFQQLGVQKVAPCHCTGDQARGVFKSSYGNDFISVGVGKVFTVSEDSEEQ
ncbi:MBL fold metallo-hydrolase [Candidatus Bipolaricaulota bacterium]|nr:MBL fold metallo-hydrolase [Candidatus Bipolaricaulota bacterium]